MKKYQLMAPGPTPVPPNVLLAMAQPMIHHRTPEYDALFAEVRAGPQAAVPDEAGGDSVHVVGYRQHGERR